MTTDAQAQQLARIQAALRSYSLLASQVIRNNPHQDIGQILGRPDLSHALASGLGTAQEHAVHMVTSSWSHADTATRQHLIADVGRAYDGAGQAVTDAVAQAWSSVPQGVFTVGVSTPGTNPALETAVARATAVQEATGRVFRSIALRNALSASVAASASRSEATIEQARQLSLDTGTAHSLVWRSRKIVGVTCAWCWDLDGTVVEPGGDFPHPGQRGGRNPPRLWRGVLHGPPLHPNCMCWLEIREAPPSQPPTGVSPTEEPPHLYTRSSDIKAMPEERYQSLIGYLRSALHELGHVIRRLLEGFPSRSGS